MPIKDLSRAAAELESAIQDQASSRTKRVSTSKALDDNLAELSEIAEAAGRGRENTLADDAPVMAVWKTTRKLQRSSPRPSDPTPQTETYSGMM
jgi:hypothetical protein